MGQEELTAEALTQLIAGSGGFQILRLHAVLKAR